METHAADGMIAQDRQVASIEDLAWGDDGLLPVIIQDASTQAVLTLAFANRVALERTLQTKSTWLYSRSRRTLWKKGETSGNTQRVVGIRYDCDADALLYRVVPAGPPCHTGAPTCFSFRLLADAADSTPAPAGSTLFTGAIESLRATIVARRDADPAQSYTSRLLHDGVDRIGKKIGEEATEVVIAAKNGNAGEIAWEVADLVYHTLVLLEERNVPLDAVGSELLRRAK